MYEITPLVGFSYDTERVSIIKDQVTKEIVAAATVGDILNTAADMNTPPKVARQVFTSMYGSTKMRSAYIIGGELLHSENRDLLPNPNRPVQYGIRVASFPEILDLLDRKERGETKDPERFGAVAIRVMRDFAGAVMLD